MHWSKQLLTQKAPKLGPAAFKQQGCADSAHFCSGQRIKEHLVHSWGRCKRGEPFWQGVGSFGVHSYGGLMGHGCCTEEVLVLPSH